MVTALKACDLSILPGEYVALVGPSGSGKSTLLNIIGMLDRPTGGRYLFQGRSASDISESEQTFTRAMHIGFVFQSFHLLPQRTAIENVAIGLLYRGSPKRAREEAALSALERVGLERRAMATPSQLSGGEKQRVAVARALIGKPRILLCDEPTGNLDTATAGGILDVVKELNDDGLTVVVVSHDPVVAKRARRIVTIRDGVVRDSGVGVSADWGIAP